MAIGGPSTSLEGYLSSLLRSYSSIQTIKVNEVAVKIVSILEGMEITAHQKKKIARKIYHQFEGSKELFDNLVLEFFKYRKGTIKPETRAILNYLTISKHHLVKFTKKLWNLKHQEIRQRTPQGLPLIYLCAHFSEHKIPLSWLDSDCESRHVNLLFKLAKHRVLRLSLAPPTCYLPKDLSRIIRREKEFPDAVRALVRACETLDFERPETWPHARLWSKHAKCLLQSPFLDKMTSYEKTAIYTTLGLIHATIAMHFDKALKYLHLARELIEPSEDLIDLPSVYSALGTVYNILADRENSIRYHLKALKLVDPEKFALVLDRPGIKPFSCIIGQQNLGHLPSEVSADRIEQVCEKLSWTLIDLGEFDLVQELHPQKENDQLNAAKNFLISGTIAYRRGDDSQTVELCSQGIEAMKGAPSYPVGVALLARLASATSSEKEYKKARTELEKLYPKLDHFDCACMDSDIGNVCLEAEKYQEAIEYFNSAIAKLEKLLDTRMHPFLAENYVKLGKAYLRTNYKEEARKFIDRAQSMYQILSPHEEGSFNLATVDLSYCLGELAEDDEQYSSALEFYNKAFTAYLQLYGKDNQIVRELAKALKRVSHKQQGTVLVLPAEGVRADTKPTDQFECTIS